MEIFNKEGRVKYLGFDDSAFFVVGVIMMTLFTPIAFFDIVPWKVSSSFLWKSYFESFIHTFSYWIVFRYFVIYIRKRYPDFEDTRKRIWIVLIFILVFAGVIGGVINFFINEYTALNNEVESLEGFIATYFTSFFVISIYEGGYLYHQNKKNILTQEALKREHVNSQLQGLRNQVNPHFLFNSLNTLMNIVQEDQKLAESFLTKLSSVYRYTLENREDQLVTMKEERRFIDAYVFLLKERFKNNLEVNIDISEFYLEKYVVPMSMQLLFENVIKHNIISTKFPLLIEVYVDDNQYVTVRNNIQLKQNVLPSTGVGLSNISSRIKFFTDRKLHVSRDDKYFTVSIPLINRYKTPVL